MQDHHLVQTTIVAYLDTETNFGENPVASSTNQIGVHCPRLGLDLRLGNKRSAQKLWLDLFSVLKTLLLSSTSTTSGHNASARYVLVAHNGFAFDFMNMVDELAGAVRPGEEKELALVMSWLSSSGQVGFVDSMELVMESFRARGLKSPRSFSLDALHSTFIGACGGAAFVGRHDGLEDARMLRLVLERIGITEGAVSALAPLGWADLLVMHRSWRVRQGLLKNPSRPAPTPRVFTVPSCVGSCSISLFKANDAGSFTAIVAPANADGRTHILAGNLEGRTQGLPARMRAWTSVIKSVGKRGAVRQTKQLFSADSENIELYADHPLLTAANTLWYKDPACVLPDDVIHVMLIDQEADKIMSLLDHHHHHNNYDGGGEPAPDQEENQALPCSSPNTARKLSSNVLEATAQLKSALELLLKVQGIGHSWQQSNGEAKSFI